MAASGYDPRKASGGLYAFTAEDGVEMVEVEVVDQNVCGLVNDRRRTNLGCLGLDKRGSLSGEFFSWIVGARKKRKTTGVSLPKKEKENKTSRKRKKKNKEEK